MSAIFHELKQRVQFGNHLTAVIFVLTFGGAEAGYGFDSGFKLIPFRPLEITPDHLSGTAECGNSVAVEFRESLRSPPSTANAEAFVPPLADEGKKLALPAGPAADTLARHRKAVIYQLRQQAAYDASANDADDLNPWIEVVQVVLAGIVGAITSAIVAPILERSRQKSKALNQA